MRRCGERKEQDRCGGNQAETFHDGILLGKRALSVKRRGGFIPRRKGNGPKPPGFSQSRTSKAVATASPPSRVAVFRNLALRENLTQRHGDTEKLG